MFRIWKNGFARNTSPVHVKKSVSNGEVVDDWEGGERYIIGDCGDDVDDVCRGAYRFRNIILKYKCKHKDQISVISQNEWKVRT